MNDRPVGKVLPRHAATSRIDPAHEVVMYARQYVQARRRLGAATGTQQMEEAMTEVDLNLHDLCVALSEPCGCAAGECPGILA